MRSRWVDRDAKAAVDRYATSGIAPDVALRIYTTRLLGSDPALVLHGGGNTSLKTTHARSRGRRGRGAVRQGHRRRHGDDRARRHGRGEARSAAEASRARRPVRRRHGARAARLADRAVGAEPLGGIAAARLRAARLRRSHPRQRRGQPDRPAGRRKALRGGVRQSHGPRALCAAGLRPRQGGGHDVRQESEGRRTDPRQARHLHLRRKREGILRAHDRTGQPRRGAA